MLFFSPHQDADLLRGGMASSEATPSSSRAARPDSARRHRQRDSEILGRYNNGSLSATSTGEWATPISAMSRKASRVTRAHMQCDIYHPHPALADLMTISSAWRPRARRHGELGLRSSYQKPSACPQAWPIAAPVRDERPSWSTPRVRSHGRHRRASPPNARKTGASSRSIGRLRRGMVRDRRRVRQELGALLTTPTNRRSQGDQQVTVPG